MFGVSFLASVWMGVHRSDDTLSRLGKLDTCDLSVPRECGCGILCVVVALGLSR